MNEEAVSNELEGVLKREVKILQNLIDSLQKENDALLENHAEKVKHLTGEREEIVKALLETKNKRFELIKKLIEVLNLSEKEAITEENCLTALEKYAEETCGTIKILRDQIIELLERIAVYSERNSYLLKHKIHITRDLIDKLHPQDLNTTYSPQGKVGKKAKKVSTATIINQEG